MIPTMGTTTTRPLSAERVIRAEHPLTASFNQMAMSRTENRGFDEMDYNNDGIVSRSEFLFHQADRNHDGFISESEFNGAFRP